MLKWHSLHPARVSLGRRFHAYELGASLKNDFVRNGDGTVTDRTTGVIWMRKGYRKRKNWDDVMVYSYWLSNRNHLGCAAWRIPAVEEFASLIETTSIGGNAAYIAPVFNCWRGCYWSADCRDEETAWLANFRDGQLSWGCVRCRDAHGA
jgi:hypothetical protein